MGKTGAWILLIKLLHDHLCSSQGVTVENLFLPISMFLSPSNRPSDSEGSEGNSVNLNHNSSSSLSSSNHCRIVPLKYLHSLLKKSSDTESKGNVEVKPTINITDVPTQSTAESSFLGVGPSLGDRCTVSVSQYMMYDFTHSCNECSPYIRGSPVPPEFLTFALPLSKQTKGSGGVDVGGGGGAGTTSGSDMTITLQWYIPSTHHKLCVINASRKTLERLNLPTMKAKRDDVHPHPMTPIFVPTFGRDSSGLFNLFHSHYFQLHVLVTSISEFDSYCKAWPNHIVMGVPDREATGLGMCVSPLLLPSLSLSCGTVGSSRYNTPSLVY